MLLQNDVDSTCSMIRSIKKSRKKRIRSKKIRIKLFKEDDYFISARLSVSFNINTEHANFCHSLKYRRIEVAPETHPGKIKCVNQHGIDILNKQRITARDYNIKAYKSKSFGGVMFVFNVITKNCSVRFRFHNGGKSIFL